MNIRQISMAAVLAGFTISGCECAEVPFSQTLGGSFEVELGSDPACAGDPAPEVDAENGTYFDLHYENDGANCTIFIDEWRGSLADLAGVQAEVDAQIAAAGLDPDSAGVELRDVSVSAVTVRMETASGGDFDEGRINSYTATANVEADGTRIAPAIEVSGQGDGQPDVTTTDDGAGFADAIQSSIEEAVALEADGDAVVDIPFDAMVDLTDNGTGPGKLIVDYDLTLDGVLLIQVGG
jgi:hypothetical protein